MSEAEKRLEKCVDALYKVLAIVAVEIDAIGVMAEKAGRSINRAFEQYSAAHYELMHLEDEEDDMSDNTPITGELREYATASWNPWPAARDRLYQMCDTIDAIHANLERENESLRREQDRVMVEQDHDGWVELPKDADGVPIHAGDTLDGYGKTIEVVELRHGRSGWVLISRDGNGYADTYAFSHHQPDTWERIIEDARTCTGSAGHYTSVPSMRWTSEVDALVARCRALAGE